MLPITKKVILPKPRTAPIKIAIMSNGPELPTGYAKVIREIGTRLNNDSRFEVTYFNENYGGQPAQWNGIPVIGVWHQDMGKIAENVVNALQQVQPDILFVLEDSFTLKNFGFERLMKLPCKRVFYIPLDGGWVPSTGINVLRSMDLIVSMAKFTQDELQKDGFDSEMIWHGVDLDLFHPVSPVEQKILKEAFGFKSDDFLIFNYGRNSLRKNNQALIETACKYLKDAPSNHKVWLHIMEKEDEHLNLVEYLTRHMSREYDSSVTDRIVFTKYTHKKPASDQEVAAMIKASDLIFSLTTGEGFGLIMAEGMAAGKPIVHPDYTTPYELLIDDSSGIGPRGWVVKPRILHTSSFNTTHAFTDSGDFAMAIREAVSDPNQMKYRGINGRIFAERFLNWDYLTESWKELFIKLV